MKWLDVIARFLHAVFNWKNASKKRDYANDPANAIANGDGVQQSEKSFSDLAGESKRDSTK